MGSIQQEIQELKKSRHAVILAHNYTLGEVQDIADFTGDSLELSRKAAECHAWGSIPPKAPLDGQASGRCCCLDPRRAGT